MKVPTSSMISNTKPRMLETLIKCITLCSTQTVAITSGLVLRLPLIFPVPIPIISTSLRRNSSNAAHKAPTHSLILAFKTHPTIKASPQLKWKISKIKPTQITISLKYNNLLFKYRNNHKKKPSAANVHVPNVC